MRSLTLDIERPESIKSVAAQVAADFPSLNVLVIHGAAADLEIDYMTASAPPT
ncbi:MAG: hypothetical protein WBE74_25065 [Terracidiphilus sp.]